MWLGTQNIESSGRPNQWCETVLKVEDLISKPCWFQCKSKFLRSHSFCCRTQVPMWCTPRPLAAVSSIGEVPYWWCLVAGKATFNRLVVCFPNTNGLRYIKHFWIERPHLVFMFSLARTFRGLRIPRTGPCRQTPVLTCLGICFAQYSSVLNCYLIHPYYKTKISHAK